MNKLIGEVIDLHPARGGHAVRVYRYPSGRKLPETRILLNSDGTPFASRYSALEALKTYSAGVGDVKPLRKLPPIRRVKPSSPAPVPLRNAAFIEPAPAKRHRKRVVELPPVVKMPEPSPRQFSRDAEHDMIAMMIATGAIKVTRCPDGARERDSMINYRVGGGVLPGHLDPRVLPESAEEREEREREQIVETHNAAVSRRKRVGKIRRA